MRNLGGSPFTGNFKRWLESSGVGATLSVGPLLGEPFLGIWKDMGRRAQGTGGMDITLRGGPAGEFVDGSSGRDMRRLWRWAPFSRGPVENHEGWGTFNSTSERWLKGALEMGHLSLGEHCEGNLVRGLLYWGP